MFRARKHSTNLEARAGLLHLFGCCPEAPPHSISACPDLVSQTDRCADTFEDFKARGKTVSMKRGRAERIVAEVRDAFANWESYAQAAGGYRRLGHADSGKFATVGLRCSKNIVLNV